MGLTQKQLAERAGVSIASIRDLEQGRVTRPYPASAQRLSTALGLGREQQGRLMDAARGRDAVKAGSTGPQPDTSVHGRPRSALADVEIRVLGPLRVWRLGVEVELLGSGPRTILALLATRPNSLVRRGTIIEVLWGENPPGSAVAIVQTHVSRLRSVLGLRQRGRLGSATLPASDSGNYTLRVTDDHLDLLAFRQHSERARSAAAMGNYLSAFDAYAAGLQLWRGEPLGNIGLLQGHAAIDSLMLRRAAMVTDFAEVACRLGQHDRVLPYLHELAVADPLNERAHAWLMIALAGSGQQAAALDVYERVRRRLKEQLGLVPGAELMEAQAQVLRQQIAVGRPLPRLDLGRAAPLSVSAYLLSPLSFPGAG